MEHLLLPHGATVAANERAAHVAEPYDGGPFLEYPQRSRFKHLYDAILPPDGIPVYSAVFDEQQMKDFEIFVQTWLFFGLLHEVFGKDAPEDAFVVESSDGKPALVSTAKLSGFIDAWIAKHIDLDEDGKELLEHLVLCILKIHRVLVMVRDRPTFDRAILWTVASLAETLAEVILETLDKGTRSLNTPWNFYNTSAVAERMTENGVCPSDVAVWRNSVIGFQTIYYLSKIEQPKIKDHSLCVGTNCVANQYDRNNRPTVHRCADKACGSFAVDDEKVMAALADGRIALLDISVDGDDLNSIKIDVIPSTKDHKYVALSHVWVDGLGNPSGNELPRCQLAWVAKIVKELGRQTGHGDLLLWLDTLCCPVRSNFHRLLCITRMREIYRDASQVLVLDAALGHYNSEDLDAVELAMRLMFSGWMRRLWTLQEGALARNLWLQLKDKAVDVDETEKELLRLFRSRFIHSPLLTELYATVKRLRDTINPARVREPTNLTQMIQAVDFRSVSVPTDEALCLCTFLDLDQEAMVKARPEERMAAFWQAMGQAKRQISRNLIFFTGPRETQERFRWAPKSFLGSVRLYNIRRANYTDELAIVTPQGLRVQLGAIQVALPEILPPSDKSQWDHLLREVPSMCYVRYNDHTWLFLYMVPGPTSTKDLTLMDVLLRNQGSNTILLEHGLETFLSGGSNDTGSGLIGHVPDDSPTTPIIHSEECLSVLRLPRREVIISEAAWRQAQDPVLRATIRPWHKDPDEEPLFPNDASLSLLPNATLKRMQELADVALQDPEVSELFPGTPEKRQENFMGRIMLLLTGRVGIVEREWPSSQTWYVD